LAEHIQLKRIAARQTPHEGGLDPTHEGGGHGEPILIALDVNASIHLELEIQIRTGQSLHTKQAHTL